MRNKVREPAAVRCSFSLHPELLTQFDALVGKTPGNNRSTEISDMIRARLIEEQTTLRHGEVMGTITLLYDHHKPHLQAILTNIQHDHHHQIVSTLHVHLDHDNCLEVLVVRGKGTEIKKLADLLSKAKGVKNGKMTVTGTGKKLPV